jgi:Spy/CpxP family protein refolding chaperone
MTHWIHAGLAAMLMLSFTAPVHASGSPYAGQEKRTIKALSEQEINDYLNGSGMGTSKAAELNHYPGPRHVLDDAKRLNLSDKQLAKTKRVHETMTQNAKRIGSEIVNKEAELEALYASQKATAENTEKLVNEIAKLQAAFRLVHLNAHLSMRQILSPQQIQAYDRLRGYDGAQLPGHHHKRH